MNEFEWRRQLRDLRTEVEPPARVWDAIASRIAAEDAARLAPTGSGRHGRSRHWQRPLLAVAAMLVLGIGIALTVSLAPPSPPGVAVAVRAESPDATRVQAGDDDAQSAELARNPVLAATDAELRELQEQIQRALVLEPDSSSLRRMLSRTESERRRLLQYQSQLG